MTYKILAIPALNDNYIWTIVHPRKQTAVIVDPGEAEPVLQLLEAQKLQLAAILITHYHWDHTNGIKGILQQHPVPVYAPTKDVVSLADHQLKDGDRVNIEEVALSLDVIEIPGHTLGHVAYHGQGWAFTGDTLFAADVGEFSKVRPINYITH